ncbi:hypothetical protein ABVT39_020262 [Epinephelus coioides]
MADMEAKLRVIIDDRIEKLVLPSGIPPTLEELQTIVKETFGISIEFSLQYLDSEFEDYFTLHNSDLIKHKDTIKVVHTAPILLNLYPCDESLDSSFVQQSTDCDSASFAESTTSNAESTASNAESSAGTSSSQDTIILSRRRIVIKLLEYHYLNLQETPSNPNINMTRDVVIRCLMMYLGESTDQLLKEYDVS